MGPWTTVVAVGMGMWLVRGCVLEGAPWGLTRGLGLDFGENRTISNDSKVLRVSSRDAIN